MSQVLSLLCMKLLITIMLLHPHKRHAVCFLVQEHQIAAHEQLYQDAIRRRLRQEEMAHWFPEDVTFQPTLETGGHHPDSTKVMADPTLNVSDRSAVFVGDSMVNVNDSTNVHDSTKVMADPTLNRSAVFVGHFMVSVSNRSNSICDVLWLRILLFLVCESTINVFDRSVVVLDQCVWQVNRVCAWSVCWTSQQCSCMHGQRVGQVSACRPYSVSHYGSCKQLGSPCLLCSNMHTLVACTLQHAPKSQMESKAAFGQDQPPNTMSKFHLRQKVSPNQCACGSISASPPHYPFFPAGCTRGGRRWRLSWQQCGQRPNTRWTPPQGDPSSSLP